MPYSILIEIALQPPGIFSFFAKDLRKIFTKLNKILAKYRPIIER